MASVSDLERRVVVLESLVKALAASIEDVAGDDDGDTPKDWKRIVPGRGIRVTDTEAECIVEADAATPMPLQISVRRVEGGSWHMFVANNGFSMRYGGEIVYPASLDQFADEWDVGPLPYLERYIYLLVYRDPSDGTLSWDFEWKGGRDYVFGDPVIASLNIGHVDLEDNASVVDQYWLGNVFIEADGDTDGFFAITGDGGSQQGVWYDSSSHALLKSVRRVGFRDGKFIAVEQTSRGVRSSTAQEDADAGRDYHVAVAEYLDADGNPVPDASQAAKTTGGVVEVVAQFHKYTITTDGGTYTFYAL